MILSKNLSKKTFAIYGLGLTGISVIKFLKRSKVKKYCLWDDKQSIRKKFGIKGNKNFFSSKLDFVDFIVMSPGINIKKSKIRKTLQKNKKKIITDIDLFYMTANVSKSIVVTGTNGKSTTCKILEHVLKKNKIKAILGGNIGKPILSFNSQKKTIFIIEVSSYQLSYSKFIKPNYAMILNITKDHQDWHENMHNYINAKMKIFSLQDKKCIAFLDDKKLIKKFKKNKNSAILKFVNKKKYKKIKHKIKNSHITSKANDNNLPFIFDLSKIFKIKERTLVKSLNSFKGLPHRYEIFLKNRKLKFINDSKATSFEASKYALNSNSNILWIVGGREKKGDKFHLKNLKKNIIKSYLIGKNTNYFRKQLSGQIPYEISKTISYSLTSVFKMIKNNPDKNFTILLSPASASFDQYNNFSERGNEFKKIVRQNAKKYF